MLDALGGVVAFLLESWGRLVIAFWGLVIIVLVAGVLLLGGCFFIGMRIDAQKSARLTLHGTQFSIGQSLAPGAAIDSPNKVFRLTLQTDGNLVLYSSYSRSSGTISPTPYWSSETKGQAISALVLQDDGNLVLYRKNHTVAWASGTDRRLHTRLTLRDDGVLTLYTPKAHRIWSADSPPCSLSPETPGWVNNSCIN